MAFCFFAASLVVAFFSWREATRSIHEKAQSRFELHAMELATAFQNRIEDFSQNLRAMRAMVLAGGPTDHLAGWNAYVEATAQDTFAAGVESMTFLRVLTDKEIPDFIDQRRREKGAKDFTLHAVGLAHSPIFDHVVIDYIGPENRQNEATYGADVTTDPKRLPALIAACDSGKVAATVLTTLIDRKDETGHLLLYLPVYRGKPATVEERRRQIWAFVSSSVNIEGMIETTQRAFDEELKGELKKGLGFVITDVTDPGNPIQIGNRASRSKHDISTVSTIPIGGRIWSIEVNAPAALYRENTVRPWLVPLSIMLIGLLVAGLVIALGQLWVNMTNVERANAALRESDEKLRQLALTDPLTGLGNRRQFLEVGSLEWARLMRNHRPAAVLMIDADHFKAINDTHGHPVGDSVLVMLAGVLRASLRECDLLARIGGEEFSVLLPETGLEAAQLAAERIRAAAQAMTVPVGQTSISVTLSIGVAHCEKDDVDFTTMLMRADEALYIAKNQGRNQVAVFPANAAPSVDRKTANAQHGA